MERGNSGTIAASYVNGKYHIAASTMGMSYYYVVLTNTSGSPAKNATYRVEKDLD